MTTIIAAVALVVVAQSAGRPRDDGPLTANDGWLVAVPRDRLPSAPGWRRTAHSVTTAAAATTIFRRYRPRWAIEDAVTVSTQGLGGAEVPVLECAAGRCLVARGGRRDAWMTWG